MKALQIFALILTLFFPLSSYGQWLCFNSFYWMKHANGEDEFYSIWQYGAGNVLSGKEYRHFEDSRHQSFFCRTEDNKLFRYVIPEEKEYVLCDYNLKVGDIFQTKDGREMKVVMKGDTLLPTTFLEKQTFQYIKLKNMLDPSDTDLWINSFLGSTKNILMFSDELDNDIVDQRFMWNDVGIVNEFNTEHVKTQLMRVDKTDDYLSYDEESGEIIYPSDSLHCKFVNDTLVLSGRLYTNCSNGHYIIIHVEGMKITLTVQEIPPYASCESSHYFTASFPGFKPGYYSMEYIPTGNGSPSGELEMTGDLVCKEYTNINTLLGKKDNAQDSYDLSGRRLSCPPEHGVYIQGGRVRVK